MGSEAEKDFADENMALHWIDRYAAGIDDYPQLDLIAEALAPGAASEVLCHRLHTPTGKWMWMDGPPSQGALDDAMNFGWKMEYAYADRLAASLPVALDAKRYRWLREQRVRFNLSPKFWTKELDAAVDAAMIAATEGSSE